MRYYSFKFPNAAAFTKFQESFDLMMEKEKDKNVHLREYDVNKDNLNHLREAGKKTQSIIDYYNDLKKKGNTSSFSYENFNQSGFNQFGVPISSFSAQVNLLKRSGQIGNDAGGRKTPSTASRVANTAETPAMAETPKDWKDVKDKLSPGFVALMQNLEKEGEEEVMDAGKTAEAKYKAVRRCVAMAVSGRASKNSAIIAGQAGIGKGQPAYSKIKTPTGWTTMGEIKEGDLITTPANRTATVLAKYPQGIRPVYELTFSDGRKVRCDINHLWNIKKGLWKKVYDEFGKRHCIYAGHTTTTVETKEILRKFENMKEAIKNRTRKPENHSIEILIPYTQAITQENEIKDLPLDPYILGLFLGDGCLTQKNSIRYSSADKQLLDAIDDYLKEFFPELEQKQHHTTINTIDSRIIQRNYFEKIKGIAKQDRPRNKFIQIFKELGLSEHSSYNKFIPEQYKNSTTANRMEILRGLFDTDGYCAKDSGVVEFSSTSERLANDVAEIVYSLGGRCTIVKKEKAQENFHDYWTCTINFGNKFCPFKLERKKERWEKYFNRRRDLNWLLMTDIVYVGDEETWCILIDDPEHLYLTDNYIVTHNTFACEEVLAKAGLVKQRDLKKLNKKSEYFFNNGSVGTSKTSTISFLFKHRDHELIVLDDCDSFLISDDMEVKNVLKAAFTMGKEGGHVTTGSMSIRVRVGNELANQGYYIEQENLGKMNDSLTTSTIGKALNHFLEDKNLDIEEDEHFTESDDDLDDMYDEDEDNYDDDNEDDDGGKKGKKGSSKAPKIEQLLPEHWTFTSKMICVTNLNLSDIDPALLSRSNTVEIQLTDEEFIYKLKEIKEILGNKETPLPLKEFQYYKEIAYEVLLIALEAAHQNLSIKGIGPIVIRVPLEFRILTFLTDNLIAIMDEYPNPLKIKEKEMFAVKKELLLLLKNYLQGLEKKRK
jgi:hypothetical protein